MAVFSEPTAAVDRALSIQRKIHRFNLEHPDLEDLSIRIGIHLGQVAVEDSISTDVFGRHVNRASRIEGLADGGQIFLTYSVFDSARGWLSEQRGVEWKLHGTYYLRGIPEPVDIYEVVDRGLREPRAPKGARKKRNIPGLAAAALLVLPGIGGALGVVLGLQHLRKAEVVFYRFHPKELYLDHGERIYYGGQEGEDARESLTPISPGEHVLHYDASALVRYYSTVNGVRGKNILEPRFEYYELPNLTARLELEGAPEGSIRKSENFDYFTYSEGRRRDRKGIIDLQIDAEQSPQDPGELLFTARWNLVLDGSVASAGTVEERRQRDNWDSTWPDEVLVWEDDYHYYWFRYYVSGDVFEIESGSYFIEYR